MKINSAAWDRGYQSCVDGYPITDCPFVGKYGQSGWEAGWNYAKRDRDAWESELHGRAISYGD